MSAKSRIIRNLYATGLGQGVTIAVQLISVPLFLHFWGVERYGEWLVLSTVPAYLAMSDFGFAGVAANDMTMSVARQRRDQALATFQSAFGVILLAVAVSGVVTAALAIAEAGTGVLPIGTASGPEIVVVIVVFWAQVALTLMGGLINAGYRCDGNFAAGTLWANVLRLCEFAVTAAIVVVGGAFVAVALAVLATRAMGTAALAAGLLHRSPWLAFGVRGGSRDGIKRLVRPALAFSAFPLGNALIIQGIVLVVGWAAGPAAVAMFAAYRTLTRFPFQLMGMVNVSIWPELSRSFGEGNIGRARRLHRIAVTSSVWLVLLALAGLFVIGEPVLRLWTRGQVPLDRHLFLLLEGVVLANSVWSTSSVVMLSTNRHQKIAVTYLLGSAGALALALALGRIVGLPGIAAALFVVDISMTSVVLRQSLSLTEDNISGFMRWFALAPHRSISFALHRGR